MTTVGIIIETDVRVPMRDGIQLASDVFRPVGDDPHPVLLIRTPYNRSNRGVWGPLLFDFEDAVTRGYVVVAQDCRGTGSSDGVFCPIVQERDDGHDTITWAATQPWSDGNVGIWGMSYMGVTAAQALVDAPPALKAGIVYLTAANYQRSWAYTGGALEFGFSLRWMVNQANAQLTRPNSSLEHDIVKEVQAEVARFQTSPERFYSSHLDIRSIAPGASKLVPYCEELIAHQNDSHYWQQIDVVAAADRVGVPVLAITGWQDAFLRSLLDLHDALVSRGPHHLRSLHRLVVGPWDHQAYLSSQTAAMSGRLHFGPNATGGRSGLRELAFSFFDRWLRARPSII